MYDQYETSEPYSYISFENFYVDAKNDFKLSDKFTLTPQVRYFNQIPWQYGYFEGFEEDGTVYEPNDPYTKIRAERIYGSLSGSYDITRKLNVNFGALYFKDKATDMLETDYLSGANTLSFNNAGFFAQALLKHRLANATLGFRYENNSQYGDAFVPRLALTKKIENFHFKILYSQAFRAPSIENINLALDGEIKPEKSQVLEFEFGYQFTPEMLLAVNAFDLRTKDVIIYNSTAETDFYSNYDKSGSRGVELVYNIRRKGWYSYLTYSFSQAGDNTVDTYVVPTTDKQFIAMPMNKLTLNTNFNLTNTITFNPTFISVGKRYAYMEPDVVSKLDPYLLVNAFVNFRNVISGLTAGLGVYDILNERPAIPQAYNGGFAPVPGRSREYVVKLSYQLNFKN